MGGTAIWRASDEIIAKGTRIAADALEAAEADIRFEDGRFVVSGTDRSVALLDVAAIARDKGTLLDTYHAWTREWMTFPNHAHVVEVEIDRDTGKVKLARYTALDDYGVLVNPMIATGQAHGACRRSEPPSHRGAIARSGVGGVAAACARSAGRILAAHRRSVSWETSSLRCSAQTEHGIARLGTVAIHTGRSHSYG